MLDVSFLKVFTRARDLCMSVQSINIQRLETFTVSKGKSSSYTSCGN